MYSFIQNINSSTR